eukprot:1036479-Rhodomonas_salina.2
MLRNGKEYNDCSLGKDERMLSHSQCAFCLGHNEKHVICAGCLCRVVCVRCFQQHGAALSRKQCLGCQTPILGQDACTDCDKLKHLLQDIGPM